MPIRRWHGGCFHKADGGGQGGLPRCQRGNTNHDGRSKEGHGFRGRRVWRRGDQHLFEQGYGAQASGDDSRGQAARSLDCRRGGSRHPALGDGPRRHALHALVPSDDRIDGRKARFVPRNQGRRADHAVQRQEPDRRRAGRLVVPVRRHSLDVRGARLHGLGSDKPRVHQAPFQRGDALHSHRLLRLHGRIARQEDSASPVDAGARQVVEAADAAVRARRGAHGVHARGGAGILPRR